MLLFSILSIVTQIRSTGCNLYYLQVQLLRHLANLVATTRQATTAIWQRMYEGVMEHTMDDQCSLQGRNVVRA